MLNVKLLLYMLCGVFNFYRFGSLCCLFGPIYFDPKDISSVIFW